MARTPPACLVEIDGVTLAVDRAGRGAPVVCLHSVGHDGRDFDALTERCGDAFEFVRVDWPGHGRSGPDHVPASAARYAEILEDLLQHLGIDNPLLIGNSIGGAAAIIQAARHPARGLVLCDSGGLVAVDTTVKRFCGLFERFFAAGEKGASWYPAAFDLYYRLVLPRSEARGRRREIVGKAREMAPVLRQAWASFGRPEADLREAAASIDVPIWVAWAKHDRVIPLSRVQPAMGRFKNVRLTVFEGGHTPFLEQPDAFAAEFRKFAATLA